MTVYADPGQKTITQELYVEEGQQFRVAYADVTDCYMYYSEPSGTRYMGENGVTTQLEQAKVFTGGVDKEVTLTEPACYTISGTMSRSDDPLIRKAAYVMARFENGETYAGRAVFAYGEAEAQYTIYVPQSQQGSTYQLSVAKARNNTGNQYIASTLTNVTSGTLSGNVQQNVSLAADVPTIKGTISLPAGMTAPEGGLMFSIGLEEDYSNVDYATYYLPEGKNSFSYELCAMTQGGALVYARLEDPVPGLSNEATAQFAQSELSAADLTFVETVIITGTLSVPDSCKDGVAAIQVSANGTLNGGNIYASTVTAIAAGQTEGSYTLYWPKGGVLRSLSVRVTADTQNSLSTSWLYLQSDLKSFSGQYADLGAAVSGNMSIHTALPKGLYVTGTISLPQGLSAGAYSGYVYLEPVDGGMQYSQRFDFSGTSCDYSISVPQDAMGAYYIKLYLHEGAGTVPYEYFYYSEQGMTTDVSAATAVQVGEDGAKVNLTIPKGKIISGKLVADDGGAVRWDEAETMTAYLEPVGGGTIQYSTVQVDSQGNWTFTTDPTLTGAYYLYFGISQDVESNIVRSNYYYSQSGKSVTSEQDADAIQLEGGDLSGLELYVQTGWVLSGALKLGEGGYISGGTVTMYLSARSAENKYYSGRGEVGESGGSYFIVVPKVQTTYNLYIQPSTNVPPEVSSNLYFNDSIQSINTNTITGDTGDLDFTIAKARAMITGTVYRPESVTGYFYLSLSLRTDTYGYYNTSVSIQANDNSGQFSIAIPQSEKGTTYQLSYRTSYAGMVMNQSIYLCQDGSLTTDVDQAGNFPLDNPTAHSFTPMTVAPFITGRIYCPEGLTEFVEVVVDYQLVSGVSTLDMTDTAVSVMVGPGGQQDEDGRWYATYAVGDSDLPVGTQYRLTCYMPNANDLVDGSFHFVNRDGTLTSSVADADIYTVPASGSDTVNFTPMLWDDGSENYVLQSDHGFTQIPETLTYTYTHPGNPTALKVTFSARTDVNLLINGKTYVASSFQENPTIEVTGDTLTVTMSATSYYNGAFGFAVEKVEAVGATSTVGAAALYSDSGSAASNIISDLKDGGAAHVTLVSDGTMYGRYYLLGAIYDKNGAMLDITYVPVDFDYSTGTYTASLNFDEMYGQATTFKLFLTNSAWTPRMESIKVAE